jgi:hypothetical protein
MSIHSQSFLSLFISPKGHKTNNSKLSEGIINKYNKIKTPMGSETYGL